MAEGDFLVLSALSIAVICFLLFFFFNVCSFVCQFQRAMNLCSTPMFIWSQPALCFVYFKFGIDEVVGGVKG